MMAAIANSALSMLWNSASVKDGGQVQSTISQLFQCEEQPDMSGWYDQPAHITAYKIFDEPLLDSLFIESPILIIAIIGIAYQCLKKPHQKND